jgi:hypothetical protein
MYPNEKTIPFGCEFALLSKPGHGMRNMAITSRYFHLVCKQTLEIVGEHKCIVRHGNLPKLRKTLTLCPPSNIWVVRQVLQS